MSLPKISLGFGSFLQQLTPFCRANVTSNTLPSPQVLSFPLSKFYDKTKQSRNNFVFLSGSTDSCLDKMTYIINKLEREGISYYYKNQVKCWTSELIADINEAKLSSSCIVFILFTDWNLPVLMLEVAYTIGLTAYSDNFQICLCFLKQAKFFKFRKIRSFFNQEMKEAWKFLVDIAKLHGVQLPVKRRRAAKKSTTVLMEAAYTIGTNSKYNMNILPKFTFEKHAQTPLEFLKQIALLKSTYFEFTNRGVRVSVYEHIHPMLEEVCAYNEVLNCNKTTEIYPLLEEKIVSIPTVERFFI